MGPYIEINEKLVCSVTHIKPTQLVSGHFTSEPNKPNMDTALHQTRKAPHNFQTLHK